jgi:hypothetical protein
MNQCIVICLGIVFFALSGGIGYTAIPYQETKLMFSAPPPSSSHAKNLQGVDFNERAAIEATIDGLATSAANPYTASLPLIASAGLGDQVRYNTSRTQMLSFLDQLDKNPNTYPTWMQNDAFKAWMWGRILLAADTMGDKATAKDCAALIKLISEDSAKKDNFAFYTWAQGYYAAFNQSTYESIRQNMLDNATLLSKNITDHDALSNALWAWVMNLSAAANATHQADYEFCKTQITTLTKTQSVSKALEQVLLRTADSNDYPAWALAKVQLAAAIMGDKTLYQETDRALILSISGANTSNAKAEYVLAVIENQLAIQAEQALAETKTRQKLGGRY